MDYLIDAYTTYTISNSISRSSLYYDISAQGIVFMFVSSDNNRISFQIFNNRLIVVFNDIVKGISFQ